MLTKTGSSDARKGVGVTGCLLKNEPTSYFVSLSKGESPEAQGNQALIARTKKGTK